MADATSGSVAPTPDPIKADAAKVVADVKVVGEDVVAVAKDAVADVKAEAVKVETAVKEDVIVKVEEWVANEWKKLGGIHIGDVFGTGSAG